MLTEQATYATMGVSTETEIKWIKESIHDVLEDLAEEPGLYEAKLILKKLVVRLAKLEG